MNRNLSNKKPSRNFRDGFFNLLIKLLFYDFCINDLGTFVFLLSFPE